jgi:hypothetical protein
VGREWNKETPTTVLLFQPQDILFHPSAPQQAEQRTSQKGKPGEKKSSGPYTAAFSQSKSCKKVIWNWLVNTEPKSITLRLGKNSV